MPVGRHGTIVAASGYGDIGVNLDWLREIPLAQ
jgi:hypothetical protein